MFPALSVANNLRLGGWTRRRNKADLDGQRELVFEYFPRLAERADQDAGTLSGGEQQMLAIGRALMSKPRLLLIDEASLGLSPALAKTVFQVVAADQRRRHHGGHRRAERRRAAVRRPGPHHGEGHARVLRRRRRDPPRQPARDVPRR